MSFPMQIPFKLGSVKNSDDWDEGTESKFRDLVNLINKNLNSRSKEVTFTPLNTTINLTSEYNIGYAESLVSSSIRSFEVNIPENMDKLTYYVVVDSNTSKYELTANKTIISNDTKRSLNRTVYILRKLDENTIVIYKQLQDMYIADEPDFESEDFLDWDMISG